MKISGFSFARNADALYYPVRESILSVLPICDEFVIAVGKGGGGDRTREIVQSIGNPKIRIIDTVWPHDLAGDTHIYSHQTNIALRECTGDWCLYIQSDEVVHEGTLPVIKSRCEELSPDVAVQGLLFDFRHFWGDYDHFQQGHKWYPSEIRVIRNGLGIESWQDAQSFRREGKKITVARVDAVVYHYGYVRPPDLMQRKSAAHQFNYTGRSFGEAPATVERVGFDYGPLDRLKRFTGTHPAVMKERMAAMDWKQLLQYGGKRKTRYDHDRLKYRLLTFIENTFLGGRQLGGFKNYVPLKRG
jgi:hypothetical protein